MKRQLWVLIVTASCVLAALVGFSISSTTGVEPGYFEAPDAGGYGASTEAPAAEGISSEVQDYYKSLNE
ncbi:MAG: hypothetical protein OEY11_05235 [Gammaproteobacteria bacterium]|nr:hypothetical protein [Gammaproteobacteria bacterium]